jgi:15-cis-phytoene synthase
MEPNDPGWGFPNPATPQGSSAYYSIRFARDELRDDLAALYAWRHEIRSILERVSEPGVAAVKLAWWRDELGRTFDGQPNHPLARALAPVIGCWALPPEPFLDIARAVETELTGRPPRDMAELQACAEQDLGAHFELLARAAGRTDPEPIARARRLGVYASLVYGIRDSGWLVRRGRFGFVPEDLLAGLGLEPRDLAQPAGQDRLPQALALLAARARALRGGERETAGLPVTLRIQVRLLDRLLDELESTRFKLADRRLALTPIRKLWNAWRETKR